MEKQINGVEHPDQEALKAAYLKILDKYNAIMAATIVVMLSAFEDNLQSFVGCLKNDEPSAARMRSALGELARVLRENRDR